MLKIKADCELTSVTAVHPYLGEKVSMARCGGVWFGANWTGLYRVCGSCLVTLWVADWVFFLTE